jgi:hypothetical protein
MHPLLEKSSVDKIYLDSWGLFEEDKAAYEKYKESDFLKDVAKIVNMYEQINKKS